MTPDDLNGLWFGYRDVAVGWLERTRFRNVFAVHYVVNPGRRRGYWPIHRALREMAEAATLEAQAPVVLCVLPGGVTEDYLPRLGFQWDDVSGVWCYSHGQGRS